MAIFLSLLFWSSRLLSHFRVVGLTRCLAPAVSVEASMAILANLSFFLFSIELLNIGVVCYYAVQVLFLFWCGCIMLFRIGVNS